MDKSSEGHPNAVVSLPEFPSEDRTFDKDRQDKAVQTMDNKSPDDALENSYEQPPNGSPNKASNKSSDESSDKSEERAPSSVYSSHDTDIVDHREKEEYIRVSDQDRRRLDKKQKKVVKRVMKMRLRRKIKAGNKAWAQNSEDIAMCREVRDMHWERIAAFEVEASRVQQCRAAEDRARDISGGVDGRKWRDNDQRALELQRINDDYIKLAVQLLRLKHWEYEGRKTLQYRADEVFKLLNIFDVQWREAYQRIGDNTVKLKQLALHSAKHDIRPLPIEKKPKSDDETARSDRRPKGKLPETAVAPPIKKADANPNALHSAEHDFRPLGIIEKEPKADDETVRFDKRPRRKLPETTVAPPIKKAEANPHMMAAKPAKKPAKPQQQKPPPENLRRSGRLVAQKGNAGSKD